MIEDLHISVPLSEVPEAQVGNYFTLSEMPGEFLIIQKPDNTFYFLCSRECDIVRICESFDWYIVSKDAFNDRLSIGIGLADKESIDGEVYRVQDEPRSPFGATSFISPSTAISCAGSSPTTPVSRARCASTAHCASTSTIITPRAARASLWKTVKPATWFSASRKDSRQLSSPKSSPFASPVCLSTRKRRPMPYLSPSRRLPVSATPPVSPGFAAPFASPENHRRLPCHMDKGRP